MMLQAVLWIIITAAAGFFLVACLLPPLQPVWAGRIAALSLGTGIGFGLASAATFALLFIAGPSPAAIIITDSSILLITALFYVRHRSGLSGLASGPALQQPAPNSRGLCVLAAGFIVISIAAVYLFTSISLFLPEGYADAWGIWNLRARFLYRGGEGWQSVFSPLVTHSEYPYLVSASVFRGWCYAGRESVLAPILLGGIFTFAIPLLLLAAMAHIRSPIQGMLASLLLLGMPYFIYQGAGQYADTPLAFFILATLILVALHDRAGAASPRLLVCAGLAAGLACWTKNEGLLFLFALMSARVLSALLLHRTKNFGADMLYFALGLLPVLLVLVYFKIQAPFNDLFSPSYSRLAAIASHLLSGSRYLYVLQKFIEQGLTFHRFIVSPLPVLALYLLCMGARVQPQDRNFLLTAALCLCIMAVGYFFIYVITPRDLEWHIRTSLNRLLLHLWPAVVLVFFLIAKAPQKPARELDRPQGDMQHALPGG